MSCNANIKNILSHTDHTLLAADATERDIMDVVDDGIKFGTASVCIPSCYVKAAAERSGGRVKICTVIGFPLGYVPSEIKAHEAELAAQNGADEIDMVANIGKIKSGEFDAVAEDIRAVRAACRGKILKVIIECCLLTDAEMVEMCRVVADCGADYIKTSTGFSKGGATPHNVELLCKNAPAGLKVKAAGGISSLDDAELYLSLGADRLGTSRIVKLASGLTGTGY